MSSLESDYLYVINIKINIIRTCTLAYINVYWTVFDINKFAGWFYNWFQPVNCMYYSTFLFSCMDGHMYTHHVHMRACTHTCTHTHTSTLIKCTCAIPHTSIPHTEFFILLGVSNVNLLCKSTNLFESISHPTTYCTVFGKVS